MYLIEISTVWITKIGNKSSSGNNLIIRFDLFSVFFIVRNYSNENDFEINLTVRVVEKKQLKRRKKKQIRESNMSNSIKIIIK